MRAVLRAAGCCVVLGLCALLGARPEAQEVKVRLRLVDDAGGRPRPGIVRALRAGVDKPLVLTGLFDRLRGLGKPGTGPGWYIIPAGGADIVLPRDRLSLEALSGLETALARHDLNRDAPREVTIRLRSVFDPGQSGLVAGNTHLHLRNLTQDEADEYLRQVPVADGLRVLFISYLERHKDDASYITNRYPVGELKQFSATGVLYSNGEEHRHNFEAFGQGYGHVMFLGIKDLVRPASVGPGLTGAGTDDRPLRTGIDEARAQGGTVLWCHNTNGFEDVPNALAGRLDALNVYDGSRTGTYEDNYYRYLNVGLRVPISTGTDWFVYDFSRVYARVNGELTVPSWLAAVKAGRCVATNGPLLTLRVDGKEVGETVALEQPRTVKVEAAGVGRQDFQRLQLVHNGRVVFEQPAEKAGDHYAARLTRDVRVDTPGWLALRITATTKNELSHVLYAHTSPVYLDLAGRRAFDVESARTLLKQVEEGRADIRGRGTFSGASARDQVLALYDEAAAMLTQLIERRGR